ncbi:hypothetical protein GQ55_8G163800 [Panicum hallii var. hallii]|uniref:Uncharacterized protein n=1 Tax=Panicum hallii var. hallii TaxID=1504633 RepID=A0A2T7CNB7_9POAL|nr:hypothetical protein GQ55_8G163800 [Panicum hallii var. hallii]
MSMRSGLLGTTTVARRPSTEMSWNPDTIWKYGNTDTSALARAHSRRLTHAARRHSAAPRDSSRSMEHHHHHHGHLLVVAHFLRPPCHPSITGAPPP